MPLVAGVSRNHEERKQVRVESIARVPASKGVRKHPSSGLLLTPLLQDGAPLTVRDVPRARGEWNSTNLRERQRITSPRLDAGLASIGVHNLSPGLVLTSLLLEGASPAARRFFNALAEEPETVAAALVPRMRTVQVRLPVPCLSLVPYGSPYWY